MNSQWDTVFSFFAGSDICEFCEFSASIVFYRQFFLSLSVSYRLYLVITSVSLLFFGGLFYFWVDSLFSLCPMFFFIFALQALCSLVICPFLFISLEREGARLHSKIKSYIPQQAQRHLHQSFLLSHPQSLLYTCPSAHRTHPCSPGGPHCSPLRPIRTDTYSPRDYAL